MPNPVGPPPILISGCFGSTFQNVHPSPDQTDSVFFSNNSAMREEAISKGWDFRLVRRHPLTDDYRISSIQSKYIKFLQFFDEFPEFADEERFVYCDHKFFVKKEHLDWIEERFGEDRSIFIRKTPRVKLSIDDEISEAMNQPRYAETMPQTMQWLERTIGVRGLSRQVRILNTGFISYKNVGRVRPLLDEVYATAWRLGQPECQIIWACLSQQFADRIQSVEWNDLNPEWRAP